MLLQDAADARYVPTGHLVFMRRGVLMAVPFDAERLETRGAEVPLLEPVAQALTSGDGVDFTGAGQFAVSGSGTLAWVPNPTVRFPESVLVAIDRRGKATELGAAIRSYGGSVRVSPDGRLLLVPIESLTERGLWVYDLNRRTLTPLLRDGEVTFPLWSPDGQRAVFEWLKDGRLSIAALPADGTAAPHVLLPGIEPDMGSHARMFPSSIGPDIGASQPFLGNWVARMCSSSRCSTTKRSARAVARNASFGRVARIYPPDGRWVLYGSKRRWRLRRLCASLPGSGACISVSSAEADLGADRARLVLR